MDDQGLPISIESFPGNTLDCNTFKPAISKSIDGLDYARFIMIADRVMCNYQNVYHLLDQNNGYILAKSLRKSAADEQEFHILAKHIKAVILFAFLKSLTKSILTVIKFV